MEFSFGIITAGNPDRIKEISDSVQAQIPLDKYEIIVVGGPPIDLPNVVHIPFDESAKPKWITRKKNLVTNRAKFENIVYMHDYIKIEPGWYSGFLEYGNDFVLCMNKMLNPDGSRYRDWSLWAEDALGLNVPRAEFLIPYEETSFSKYMYFSGAYWVAKKKVMLEYPLDERLSWGEGEDVEWSKKIRGVYNFSMNSLSSVRLMVYHHPIFTEISEDQLKEFKIRIAV